MASASLSWLRGSCQQQCEAHAQVRLMHSAGAGENMNINPTESIRVQSASWDKANSLRLCHGSGTQRAFTGSARPQRTRSSSGAPAASTRSAATRGRARRPSGRRLCSRPRPQRSRQSWRSAARLLLLLPPSPSPSTASTPFFTSSSASPTWHACRRLSMLAGPFRARTRHPPNFQAPGLRRRLL